MTTYLFLQLAGPYLALITGLSICVILIRNVKAQARQSGSESESVIAELRQRMTAAESGLIRLRTDLQTAEEQFRASAGSPAKSWSNISCRTQALRMLRAGQKPHDIAAELSMTIGEIELIAKVTSIVSHASQSDKNVQSGNEASIFPINA